MTFTQFQRKRSYHRVKYESSITYFSEVKVNVKVFCSQKNKQIDGAKTIHSQCTDARKHEITINDLSIFIEQSSSRSYCLPPKAKGKADWIIRHIYLTRIKEVVINFCFVGDFGWVSKILPRMHPCTIYHKKSQRA